MDDRAAVPPTLPHPNPTVSSWQDPPDGISDLRCTLELPGTADIVIIGSGISGATIVFHLLTALKRPENVVMLEARQACSGATGRNGGHTKAASYRSFLLNVETLGEEEAIKIVRFEYNNIKKTHEFAKSYGINCESSSRDTVDIIYDQNQWDNAVRSIEMMRKLMPEDLDGAARYKFHTVEEVQVRFHCRGDNPKGAVSYQGGSLSAYKLVMWMLKRSTEVGLNLQTNTPATSLYQDADGKWNVETSRGIIRASKVILASNGYTGYLVEELRPVIVPLRGQITAHRPGLNMPKELQTTYSFIYSNGYEYMISRPNDSESAGEIIMGGGLVKAPEEGLYEYGCTDDTTLNLEIHEWLMETTPKYFGESWGEDNARGRVHQEWTGIMGYSPDGFPFIGEVPRKKNLFISASFQGNGMVLCILCARALIVMMTGDKDALWDLDQWFPKTFRITQARIQNQFTGRR